jgi:hypothetical protein
MHARILTLYVAVHENTATESKHTEFTDMMDTEISECGSLRKTKSLI